MSTAHHTVNTNELLTASQVLPFQFPALYQPPPTSKNVTNIVSFLPPLDKVEAQLSVGALFSRPFFEGTNRTLISMFNDAGMMARMNGPTQQAASTFANKMTGFSKQVAARQFDQNGLCQGMPFVWQALDPNVAPYSITA